MRKEIDPWKWLSFPLQAIKVVYSVIFTALLSQHRLHEFPQFSAIPIMQTGKNHYKWHLQQCFTWSVSITGRIPLNYYGNPTNGKGTRFFIWSSAEGLDFGPHPYSIHPRVRRSKFYRVLDRDRQPIPHKRKSVIWTPGFILELPEEDPIVLGILRTGAGSIFI